MKPVHHKNYLAAIHIAFKALGLSKDDAIALKQSVTGVASAKDMTEQQRKRLLVRLSELQESRGSAPGKQPARVAQRPALERSAADDRDERWHKARVLWRLLAQAGYIRHDTDAALMAWVQRQTHVTHWRFLNSHQVNGVIESLKKVCKAQGVALGPMVEDAGAQAVQHG